jgi:hypothetical protein
VTVQVAGAGEVALARMVELASGRWEAEAIEYSPGKGLFVRVGGPRAALDGLCGELEAKWDGEVGRLSEGEAERYWQQLHVTQWAEGADCLMKVPMTPSRLVAMEDAFGNYARHYGIGGAVGWIAFGESQRREVEERLAEVGLQGMVLGPAGGSRWAGPRRDEAIADAVKRVFDPEGRFQSL